VVDLFDVVMLRSRAFVLLDVVVTLFVFIYDTLLHCRSVWKTKNWFGF